MPNINLDDAYILDETGEQVDKVAGLFTKDEDTTSGEKAFAQLNIGTAGSNRNLLDNPWFTVNQRAAATVSSVGYHLDRWYSYNNYTVTANGITTTSAGNFDQTLESALKTALNGQTVTMSAKLADGTVYSSTGTYYSAHGSTYSIGSGGGITFYITGDGKARYTFGNNLSIRAVKLELGTVSTLANDTPPDYGTELAKCQYYSRVIEVSGYFAFGIAAGSAHIQTPLQYAMRARPSVSFTGSIALFGANDLTASSIVVSAWGPSAICLDFVTTGATSRTPYIVNMTNAKIILSADL